MKGREGEKESGKKGREERRGRESEGERKHLPKLNVPEVHALSEM